jgi:hypothetical protein
MKISQCDAHCRTPLYKTNHSFFFLIFNGIDYTIRWFTRSGHYRSFYLLDFDRCCLGIRQLEWSTTKIGQWTRFFRHINLSSARLSKFDTLLTLIPLNQIESLVIDIGASTLQLSRWPHLPSLTTLRLYGLRDFEDATSFILRHSASLIHLTLGTSNRFISVCITQDHFHIQLKKVVDIE